MVRRESQARFAPWQTQFRQVTADTRNQDNTRYRKAKRAGNTTLFTSILLPAGLADFIATDATFLSLLRQLRIAPHIRPRNAKKNRAFSKARPV